MSYSSEVLADSPVGYWHMNETSGTQMTDYSGNNRHGTYVNSPTLNQTSAHAALDDNKCVSFDGSNDHVSIADNNVWSMNNTNAFTMECWVKPLTTNWRVIYGKLNTGQQEYSLQYDGTKFIWTTDTASGEGGCYSVYSDNKTYNNWYHVVVTCNGAPGSTRPKIYVNGVENTANGSAGSGGTYANGTAPLYLGGKVFVGSYMNMLLDEVAVYNTALSPTRVLAHYNAGTGVVNVDAGTITNVSVGGNTNTTVDVSTPITVNADVTNVTIDGQDASVSIPDTSVTAEVTDIQLEGHVPPTIGTGAEINAPVSNTTINAHAATVTAERDAEVTATVTNIGIEGPDIDLYDALITAAQPTHWYKMNDLIDASPPTFRSRLDDSGTVPVPIYTTADYMWVDGQTGIPASFGTSVRASASYTPQGFAVDFPTTNNVTIEMWVKTTSDGGQLISASNSSGSAYSYINTVGGKLSYTSGTIQNSTTQTTNKTITDGAWHHLVFVKTTSGPTTVYNTFVDGQYTNISLPAPSYENKTDIELIGGIAASGYVDEIAFYERAMTQQEAQQHYTVGTYVSNNVQVTAEVTDISIDDTETSFDTQVIAPRANVNVRSHMPNIVTPGGALVGVTLSNTTIDAQDAGVVATGDSVQNTIRANVTIDDTNTSVRTVEDNFKFIPVDDSSLTSADATELLSINLGAMLANQEKIFAFKLGNTGTTNVNFTVSIMSANTEIVDLVQVSSDKSNYADSVTIGTVQPNQISDPIWVKMNTGSAYPGTGTFVINVEQSNA